MDYRFERFLTQHKNLVSREPNANLRQSFENVIGEIENVTQSRKPDSLKYLPGTALVGAGSSALAGGILLLYYEAVINHVVKIPWEEVVLLSTIILSGIPLIMAGNTQWEYINKKFSDAKKEALPRLNNLRNALTARHDRQNVVQFYELSDTAIQLENGKI